MFTCKYMDVGIPKVFQQDRLTFIITPNKTLVKTPLQMFFLEPKTHYYNRRLALIRTLIELQEIRSLEELAGFCAGGNVMWTSTNAYVQTQPFVVQSGG